MALIPQREADQIRQLLAERLTNPISIDYFGRPASRLIIPGREECETCEETRALLEELASLSPQIRLNVHDVDREAETAAAAGVVGVPAIVLSGASRGNVRYLGIPIGFEFSGFLEDLSDVASGTTDLSPATREELAKLAGDVHIQVFVTPT